MHLCPAGASERAWEGRLLPPLLVEAIDKLPLLPKPYLHLYLR